MMIQPRILLVDDDPDIQSLLVAFFGRHGHAVTVASDGRAMFECLAQQPFDLLILDVMMPGEDGFSLCRRLRSESTMPVIMLTAVGDKTDRIVGLEIGADDYLVKPFDARELLARVKAVLRRSSETFGHPTSESRPSLLFAGWRLDVARRELRSGENTLIPLSGAEFDLLLAFVEHPQRVLSRDQLLDFARGAMHDAFDRSIDVQVSRLRRKLEADAKSPELIKTVRSTGYIFTAAVQRR